MYQSPGAGRKREYRLKMEFSLAWLPEFSPDYS
jgi:hypothetical protein